MKYATAIVLVALAALGVGFLIGRASPPRASAPASGWEPVADGTFIERAGTHVVLWTLREGRPVEARRYSLPSPENELDRLMAKARGSEPKPLRITQGIYGAPAD